MKKYIISTFCSAVIVPGMGQVINGQIKKGLIHMGIVFIIFISFLVKAIRIVMNILPGLNTEKISSKTILDKIDFMDYTILRVIIYLFLLFWVYSIIDAFIVGLKIEKQKTGII